MTPAYESFVASSAAAERDGDAGTALEYHRGVPMFARSAHVSLLTQLHDLRDVMTPWLWARWAAYQCTRVESPAGRSAQITQAALRYVVELLHARSMRAAWEAGEDPIQFLSLTQGQDWAYHQVATFEMGGLGAFLDDLATGPLAERAGLARQWVGARMGGYRWESTGPTRLRVRDLATDRVVRRARPRRLPSRWRGRVGGGATGAERHLADADVRHPAVVGGRTDRPRGGRRG